MNIKQIVEKTTTKRVVPFTQLTGDTIKEKCDSILIEMLVMSHNMGGHNNCLIATNPKNMWLVMHAEPPGWIGKEFREEWVPLSLVDQEINFHIKFGNILYYYDEGIAKDMFLIAKGTKWENGKPTDFTSSLLEVTGLPD